MSKPTLPAGRERRKVDIIGHGYICIPPGGGVVEELVLANFNGHVCEMRCAWDWDLGLRLRSERWTDFVAGLGEVACYFGVDIVDVLGFVVCCFCFCCCYAGYVFDGCGFGFN